MGYLWEVLGSGYPIVNSLSVSTVIIIKLDLVTKLMIMMMYDVIIISLSLGRPNQSHLSVL